MWLSSTAQQAIQAVLCIADCDAEGPVRVDEIAAVIGCSRNYLSKTLHLLTRAGVLRSARGPRGGFRLALPSERLTLARVVAPFEPRDERRCPLGRAVCSDANPCGVHRRWQKVVRRVDDFFTNTTIANLAQANPRASAETRATVRSFRHPNKRTAHGSLA